MLDDVIDSKFDNALDEILCDFFMEHLIRHKMLCLMDIFSTSHNKIDESLHNVLARLFNNDLDSTPDNALDITLDGSLNNM